MDYSSVVRTNVSQLCGVSMSVSQRYVVEQNRTCKRIHAIGFYLSKDPQQDKLINMSLRNASTCGKMVMKSKEVIRNPSAWLLEVGWERVGKKGDGDGGLALGLQRPSWISSS